MLYIVGGVARSGKSIVARAMLAQQGVPYFSLDFLMMGLARGLPQAGVDPEAPSDEIARRIWPVVEAMSVNILEVGIDYLIEGDSVLPAQIHALGSAHPSLVRPCFIGYPRVDPEAKIAAMRANSALPNDWISIYPPTTILSFIQAMIALSQQFEIQCRESSIPFFDVSDHFANVIEDVITYLRTGHIEPHAA